MWSELTDYRNYGRVIEIPSEVSVERVAKKQQETLLISSEACVWLKTGDALWQTLASLVSTVASASRLLALLWEKQASRICSFVCCLGDFHIRVGKYSKSNGNIGASSKLCTQISPFIDIFVVFLSRLAQRSANKSPI